MGNWHHLGVRPAEHGRGACFLNAEPSKTFRAEYAVQLQYIVYWSLEKWQTFEIRSYYF